VSVGIVIVLAAVLLWSSARSRADETAAAGDVPVGELEPRFALVPSGAGERPE